MSIQSNTLKDANTGFTVVGGTDVSFSIDGQAVPNGINTIDIAATDNRLRRSIALRAKPHMQQPDNSFSKQKRWVTLRVPMLEADGTLVVDTFRYEASFSAQRTAAQEKAARYLLAQTLLDADYESFHTVGSLA